MEGKIRIGQMNNHPQALELQQQHPAGNAGIQKRGTVSEASPQPMSGQRLPHLNSSRPSNYNRRSRHPNHCHNSTSNHRLFMRRISPRLAESRTYQPLQNAGGRDLGPTGKPIIFPWKLNFAVFNGDSKTFRVFKKEAIVFGD